MSECSKHQFQYGEDDQIYVSNFCPYCLIDEQKIIISRYRAGHAELAKTLVEYKEMRQV